MTATKQVIIIGAGPAGLTCAVKLAEAGVPVQVFEAAPYVGGLARSFPLWNQIVDCGPHRFFSQNVEVNEHWLRFVGKDFSLVNRLTRIFYSNRFFYYPLRPWNAFKNMGLFNVAASITSYLQYRIFPFKDPKTFEQWVTNRFGRRLYQIFFKTYSEKVWGISCAKLDAEWASQRIQKLSLYEAIKNALWKDRKKKHKTLVDQFVYPVEGAGIVYEKMTKRIETLGGKVFLSAPVRKVLLSENGEANGIALADGREVLGNYVVSTMPLTSMVKGLPCVTPNVTEACQKLYYRNTILVYLEINNKNIFPDQRVYIHSPEVRHGRITNFRNWSEGLCGTSSSSILCLEYWCFENDDIWQATNEDLGKLAIEELRKIKIIKTQDKVLNSYILKVPKSYPVYETGYKAHLEVIQNFVNSVPNLLAIGRYGAFKYNNQDHSILMGLLAAKEIVTGQRENLWSVNTDQDYQEETKVDQMFENNFQKEKTL